MTDRAGTDRAGTDRAGTDRAGTDRAGTDRAGTDRAGTDRAVPLLSAHGLGKAYGAHRVIDGIDLDVAGGQRVGIVGESGSGKTTLIMMLAGLLAPSTGQVLFDGRPVGGQPERRLGFLRSALQVVFQDPRSSLNPRMRVGDIVTEPLRSPWQRRRLSRADGRARLAEVLDAVGLPASAARGYPHELSGGQRQRVALARALAPRPRVLIADEPVSALDVSLRAQVLNLLADLVEEQGLTLILISHDLAVVRHLCPRLLVMRDGVIVEQGDTEQVHRAPQHPYTADLLAAVPRLPF